MCTCGTCTRAACTPAVAFAAYFLLAIPASVLLVLATVLLSAGLRRLFLPRQMAGVWSVYSLAYCRKWLVTQVLDNSLGVLHGLYASVFAPAWLRLMGAKVGRGAEVSTATGIVPDLLELGEYSLIADAVMLGDEEQRGGWMVLRPTAIGKRSFVGNGAYVSDGASVPDDVLIGVQTRTPDNSQLQSGQTWIGSPPILLPARERLTGFDESLTFRPSRRRWLARAAIETLRIVLPLAFLIATGYLIVQMVMPLAEDEEVSWLTLAGALALAGCLYGLASFLLVAVLKWTLVRRYRPRAAPMWTLFVWISEAVTSLYESLAVPNLLDSLRGTPMLPWALRLLGTQHRRGSLPGHHGYHRVRLRADRRRGRVQRLVRAADTPLRGPRHENRHGPDRRAGDARSVFNGPLRYAGRPRDAIGPADAGCQG